MRQKKQTYGHISLCIFSLLCGNSRPFLVVIRAYTCVDYTTSSPQPVSRPRSHECGFVWGVQDEGGGQHWDYSEGERSPSAPEQLSRSCTAAPAQAKSPPPTHTLSRIWLCGESYSGGGKGKTDLKTRGRSTPQGATR